MRRADARSAASGIDDYRYERLHRPLGRSPEVITARLRRLHFEAKIGFLVDITYPSPGALRVESWR